MVRTVYVIVSEYSGEGGAEAHRVYTDKDRADQDCAFVSLHSMRQWKVFPCPLYDDGGYAADVVRS